MWRLGYTKQKQKSWRFLIKNISFDLETFEKCDA